jgi:hypothetical protein
MRSQVLHAIEDAIEDAKVVERARQAEDQAKKKEAVEQALNDANAMATQRQAEEQAEKEAATQVQKDAPLVVGRDVRAVAALRKLLAERQADEAAKRQAETKPMDSWETVSKPVLATLSGIKRRDIQELSGFIAPPPLCQDAVEACLISLGEKFPKAREKAWLVCKRGLADHRTLIQRFQEFSPSSITPQMILTLRRYTSNPSFTTEQLARVSLLASQLVEWVLLVAHWGYDLSRDSGLVSGDCSGQFMGGGVGTVVTVDELQKHASTHVSAESSMAARKKHLHTNPKAVPCPMSMKRSRRIDLSAEIKAEKDGNREKEQQMITLLASIHQQETTLAVFVDEEILPGYAAVAATLRELSVDALHVAATPFMPIIPRMSLDVIRLFTGLGPLPPLAPSSDLHPTESTDSTDPADPTDPAESTDSADRQDRRSEQAKHAEFVARGYIQAAVAEEERVQSRIHQLQAVWARARSSTEDELRERREEQAVVHRAVMATVEQVQVGDERAHHELMRLRMQDLCEIRAMARPPSGAVIPLQALGVVMGWGNPAKKAGEGTKKAGEGAKAGVKGTRRRKARQFGEIDQAGKGWCRDPGACCCHQPELHCAGSELMAVQVMYLSGEEHALRISADRSVGCLKSVIEAQTGTAREQLVLYLLRVPTESDAMLGEEEEGQEGHPLADSVLLLTLSTSAKAAGGESSLSVVAEVRPVQSVCWYTAGLNPPCPIPSMKDVTRNLGSVRPHVIEQMRQRRTLTEEQRRTLQWCLDGRYDCKSPQPEQEAERRENVRERREQRDEMDAVAAGVDQAAEDSEAASLANPHWSQILQQGFECPLNPDAAARYSLVGSVMARWVVAVCAHHDAMLELAPRQVQLREVDARVEELLQSTKALDGQIATLAEQLEDTVATRLAWEEYVRLVAVGVGGVDGSVGDGDGEVAAAAVAAAKSISATSIATVCTAAAAATSTTGSPTSTVAPPTAESSAESSAPSAALAAAPSSAPPSAAASATGAAAERLVQLIDSTLPPFHLAGRAGIARDSALDWVLDKLCVLALPSVGRARLVLATPQVREHWQCSSSCRFFRPVVNAASSLLEALYTTATKLSVWLERRSALLLLTERRRVLEEELQRFGSRLDVMQQEHQRLENDFLFGKCSRAPLY